MFAAWMDVVLSSALWVSMVRMTDLQADALSVAAFMPAWAVCYTLSSLLAGLWVSPHNAAAILIGSCLAVSGLSAGYIILPGVASMYLITALLGCATAFFFTPFQVYMKRFDQGRNLSLNHSVGWYTFSWSAGYALGPLIGAWVWEWQDWTGVHALNGTACLLIAVVMPLLRPEPPSSAVSSSPNRQSGVGGSTPEAGDPLPDLAWMAWLFSGTGCMIVSMLRSVFPSSAAAFAMSKPQQGTVLFILSAVQALVGLGLSRGGSWMYRPKPIAMFALSGLCGLWLFGGQRHWLVFCLAAVCVGIYSGSFYFYFVYHSLVHPTRSERYVSINEAVVGVAGVLGPLAGGALANLYQLDTPYWSALALLGTAAFVQVWLHSRPALAGAGRSIGVDVDLPTS